MHIPQGLYDVWQSFLAVLYFLSVPIDDPWKCFVCEREQGGYAHAVLGE